MSRFKPGSLEWHKDQIESYKAQAETYEDLATVVHRILDKARRSVAPLAVTQVRAKSVSSFGEKALRQFKLNNPATHDPAHHLTDLCGARVITTTRDDLEAVCEIVGSLFEIEELDDTSRRLKTTEFGYRSHHLIAQASTTPILGVPMAKELLHVRFEIQIRTMLEHVWSDISHDRLYKSGFRVPDAIKRDMARLAALLEQAEEGFGKLAHDLETYKVNQGVFMTVDGIKKEIETLEMIMANESDANNKPSIAIRLASLYRVAGEWGRIIKSLTPLENAKGPKHDELLVHLGAARCRSTKDRPLSETFKKGRANLAKIARPLAPVEAKANPMRAKALAQLAWTHTRRKGQLEQAGDLYRMSYEADPSNPYHLAAYLETKLRCTGRMDVLEATRPAILRAIEACRRHAEVRIDLPWAYLTMGRLELLLGQPAESLHAYAKAVQCAHNGSELVEALEITVELRKAMGDRLPHFEWVHSLLRVGMVVKEWEAFHKGTSVRMQAAAELAQMTKTRSKRRLEAEQRLLEAQAGEAAGRKRIDAAIHEHLTSRRLQTDATNHLAGAVFIVAGATRSDDARKAGAYRDYLVEGFRGFAGTIISGGTRAGIPGELGDAARKLFQSGEARLNLLGYLPGTLPAGVKKDPAYQAFYTDSTAFDASQPLQYWMDILAANMDPASVRLLRIHGGKIAALEHRLALTFGAKVGTVHKSGTTEEGPGPDAEWSEAGNPVPLPLDRMTFRAFIQSGRPQQMLDEKQIDALGRKIHENYQQENIARLKKGGMRDWDHLREDFKQSNCEQAAYAREILRACGFEIQPRAAAEPGEIVRFAPKEIELMAEMEHGRWIVERLRSGWRYGHDKDADNRISPDLIAWASLPEESKEHDREAVRNFPQMLREAGLEVRRLRAANPDN